MSLLLASTLRRDHSKRSVHVACMVHTAQILSLTTLPPNLRYAEFRASCGAHFLLILIPPTCVIARSTVLARVLAFSRPSCALQPAKNKPHFKHVRTPFGHGTLVGHRLKLGMICGDTISSTVDPDASMSCALLVNGRTTCSPFCPPSSDTCTSCDCHICRGSSSSAFAFPLLG